MLSSENPVSIKAYVPTLFLRFNAHQKIPSSIIIPKNVILQIVYYIIGTYRAVFRNSMPWSNKKNAHSKKNCQLLK